MELMISEERLLELGLDKEQAERILELQKKYHDDFVPKEQFNEVNNQVKEAKAQLKERDEAIASYQSTDADDLQQEIEQLRVEGQRMQEEHDNNMKQLKRDYAIETELKKAKAKNPKVVSSLLDLERVEMAEDGSLIGLDEQLEDLQKSPDTTDFFEKEEEKQRVFKGLQPGRQVSPKPSGELDVTKMTYEQFNDYHMRKNQ